MWADGLVSERKMYSQLWRRAAGRSTGSASTSSNRWRLSTKDRTYNTHSRGSSKAKAMQPWNWMWWWHRFVTNSNNICISEDEYNMKHIDHVYTHWKFSVNCVWSDWANDWSSCSKSCGSGIRTTSRRRLTESHNGGENCTGSEIKEEECNPNKCPGSCNA